MSTLTSRQKEFNVFVSGSGWDSNPAIAEIQKSWWNTYLSTGTKSDSLHQQAESLRKQKQPIPTAPPTATEGNGTLLTPSLLQPSMIDKYITIGIGFMFLSFIFSLFRR